jgi:hypothetical protein
MSAEVDALTASVAKIKTVGDSAIALLKGLAAQMVTVAGDRAATLALANEINTEADTIATAVTESTPSA